MNIHDKSIEKFSKKAEKLRQKFLDRKESLFSAVELLMALCWNLFSDIIRDWQNSIKLEQQKITTCPHCEHKLYTHKVTHPIYIFPYLTIEFYHRKVRCPKCNFKESLLRRWIPFLNNRITPIVGEKLIWLSAMMPYKEVVAYLKSFWGVKISPKSVQNYVKKIAKELIPRTDLLYSNIDSKNPAWNKVYVYVDGVMVFLNNCWQEVKVGIFEFHKKGKVFYQYYAQKTNWQVFMGKMEEIANNLGASFAKVKLFLSDAGKGITSQLENNFSNYISLLDYFHAQQHLNAWLSHFQEKNKKLFAKYSKELTDFLYKGKIKKLVETMELIRTQENRDDQALLKEERFFLNHEKRLNYALFHQHKWHIGSGRVESSCRWLIQQRFKLSGMRWKTNGFNTILGLRLALYNGTLFSAFNALMRPTTQGG